MLGPVGQRSEETQRIAKVWYIRSDGGTSDVERTYNSGETIKTGTQYSESGLAVEPDGTLWAYRKYSESDLSGQTVSNKLTVHEATIHDLIPLHKIRNDDATVMPSHPVVKEFDESLIRLAGAQLSKGE